MKSSGKQFKTKRIQISVAMTTRNDHHRISPGPKRDFSLFSKIRSTDPETLSSPSAAVILSTFSPASHEG